MKLRDKVIKFVVEHSDQLSQALNKTVLPPGSCRRHRFAEKQRCSAFE